MNNYNITFSNLKQISDYLNKGYDDKFIDYLNNFRGDNIYEKFKNILTIWEHDVAYTLTFGIDSKNTKIQLSYILSQFKDISDDIHIEKDGVKIILGIPDLFEVGSIVPIYTVLKHLEFSGVKVDLTKLSFSERCEVIDKLPASLYVSILDTILKNKSKYLTMDMEFLKDFRVNFLSNNPYMFLRGLFSNFDEYYFRDIIFHLSKRIDGNLLMNSTPLEIQYYIEKYSEEMKAGNNNLAI